MAVLALTITACQHRSPSGFAGPTDPWRVMERVGDVRATKNGGVETRSLRPGETVGDDHHITTGPGTLLILARNGFQLTAGENTSIQLPRADASPRLSLDHGWLRVRLATPVDQEARIQTAEFDISASQATLTLRSNAAGTSLTVDTGSVVLATMDGRHRATLIEGGAAKMSPASGDDLLIKRASGRYFNAVSPLPASSQAPDNAPPLPAPKAIEKQSATPAPLPEDSAIEKAAAPRPGLTILPASNPKKKDSGQTASITQTASKDTLMRPAVSEPKRQSSRKADVSGNLIPSAMLEEKTKRTDSRDSEYLDTSPPDPLQVQFDLLTQGLLDGL
ncbi:MAG: hypothetical protein AAGC99_01320 [Pseudomonadota bacterium]